ncbi:MULTISPECIES: S26 family signal peptidase [unclassified Afipia]|uniref:S26 family signal peptidase n=1 Tax=unclassified Afipia TaxID=2642050 RepID=UPI000464EB76|nr:MULTISPECIES: S26 family signal peptidase [unclassified Afipia]
MNPRWRAILIAAIGIGAIGASAPDRTPHYIWNLTPSIPRGLYRLDPDADVTVTTLVAVRLPEPLATALDLNGYLPLGVPLLKRVVALPGQEVCRANVTITVDAVALPSPSRLRDSRNRPLPSWQGCHCVGDDEIFLMNWDSDDSLDGRYFSVLPRSAVIARAVPVWTDEDGDGRFIWFAPTD